jgi:hypothetical protein
MTFMRHDTRIKRVIRKYGADGYAVYNFILESIAGNLDAKSPIPDLEDTSEDIAHDLRLDTLRVQEIVSFCIEQDLFTQEDISGHIICLKMYKFLDDATRKSESVVKMLNNFAELELVGKSPTNSEKVPLELDKELDKELDNNILSEFENFWNLYDKKDNRKGCFVKWKKLKTVDKKKIFETLPVYVQSTPDPQFRKNPLSYLNQEAWNNEVLPAKGDRKNDRFTEPGYYGKSTYKKNDVF